MQLTPIMRTDRHNMLNRRLSSRTGVALAASLALLALSGCTDGGDSEPSPSVPASAAGDPTQPAEQASPLPVPPKLTNSAGIAKDVAIVECPTTEGKVSAKGTAKNSAKKAKDLVVIVIWLKNDSGDPLGSGIATLKDVKPGKSKDWTVDTTLVAQADRCVLNATAGSIKK